MEVPAYLKLRSTVRGSHCVHGVMWMVAFGHIGGGGALSATGEVRGRVAPEERHR